MGDNTNQNQIVADAAGKIVQERFTSFLQNFRLQLAPSSNFDGEGNSRNDEEAETELSLQQRHTFDYIAQIASMIQNNRKSNHLIHY